MVRQEGYLQRLAEIDAAVAQARVDPDVLLERAAGLLAGRVGCRVREAHSHLLQLAAEQGRDVRDVGADVLAAIEAQSAATGHGLRAAADQAMRAPYRAPAGRRGRRVEPGPAVDEWAQVVQQVLDGMPGEHALLTPVRDAAGAVEDFEFAAVSPSVVDLAGRRGDQIVGRRASEVYPSVVDGPVWQAWHAVLAEGEPRELGPFPYVGRVAESATQVSITARIRPVGAGLLASWVRHDEELRLTERIAQTERLGNLGWGEWDLVTGHIVWSEELYRIYERDPAAGPMPREESEALRLPEEEALHRQAAETFGRGETVDMTYRIRLNGRVKHLRAVIDSVRDVAGRPLKVYGIIQDVTAREASRVRLADVERQLREHQESLAAEHRLAAQLQQIVLPIPEAPVDLPGLRVAVRYLPAEQASRVGGDWYHAATALDGSVVLAIGDVAGHGIHAATTMAQLRHALAALTVTTTTDPAELLSHLNRLLYAGEAAAGTATAIVARYEPGTGTLLWAQAGHSAPLHTRAGRTVELERPHGPLLGAVRDAAYGTATARLRPDDLLVCYTDGLVEHRDRTLAEGLAPVVATLDRISGEGSQQPLTDLLAQLRRANPDDDTCIVAARPLPFAGPGGGSGD